MPYEKPLKNAPPAEGLPNDEDHFGQIMDAALEPFRVANPEAIRKRLERHEALCSMLYSAAECLRKHRMLTAMRPNEPPILWRTPYLAAGVGDAELVILVKPKTDSMSPEDAEEAHQVMRREWENEGIMSKWEGHVVRFLPMEPPKSLGPTTATAGGTPLGGVHPLAGAFAVMVDAELKEDAWTPEGDTSPSETLLTVLTERVKRLAASAAEARVNPAFDVKQVAKDAAVTGAFALRVLLRVQAERAAK